jgi:hypothetical protein
MSVVLLLDSLKCIRLAREPIPQGAVPVYELLFKVDNEPALRRIEGGVRKGETSPVIDRNAIVPFTDSVELTLKQEEPGPGFFHNVGSVVVKVNQLGGRTLQFTEDNAHFELAIRVV